MADGFFPCFERYRHDDYPLKEVFSDTTYLRRVKELFNALLDSEEQLELKKGIGGQQIMPLRPRVSNEMDRVLDKIDFPEGTPIRIDYGNNKFRIVLGLSNTAKCKLAYIFMIDTDHKDFQKKKIRR